MLCTSKLQVLAPQFPSPPPSNSSLFIQTNREWCQESISGEVLNVESYLLPSSSLASPGSTLIHLTPNELVLLDFSSSSPFQHALSQAGVMKCPKSLANAIQASPLPPFCWPKHAIDGICGTWFQRNPTGGFLEYHASALEIRSTRKTPLTCRGSTHWGVRM